MKDGLARSAGVIGLATLSSRVLGLARDVVTAFFLGTSWQADAFTVATRIPTLLRELFAEGAMSAAFVPAFTRTLQKSRDAAFELGAQVVNGLLIVTGAIVALGIVFAGPLTAFYTAEEYAAIPGKLELTATLTRLNMPFLIMVAVAAAFMGMLNGLRRFFMPAAAPALYNLVFIIVVVAVWTPFRAAGLDETMAFSAAMLAGGLAQMLAQWPQLRREGYRHSWRFNPSNPALREVLFLMGPGTIGVAAAQINLFVNTLLASEVNEVPSVLRYAFLLMYLPIGIFGVSVATATIPDISRQAAEGALKTMGATVSWAIRLMLVLSVPATVGLIVLAEPITRLIFERGEFDARSTMMTATALAFYAPGIVGYSIVKIASPGFYALRDARTPMFISLVTIGANLGLSIWLNSLIEYRGLALGTALAALVNAGLLLAFLSRRIGGLEAGRIVNTFVRILLASAVMGAAAHYAHDWLRSTIPGDTLVFRMAQVFAAIGIGLIVFAAAAFALRVHEVGAAFQRVLGRVRR